jgi:hypothetical protein
VTSFKDSLGREWLVTINWTAKERVKATLKLDLYRLDIIQQVADDLSLMIEVLYQICKEQADKTGLTKEQFGDGITGDAIDAAGAAFTEALMLFFPQRRRDLLRKALAAAKEAQEIVLASLTQKLDSGEVREILQKQLSGQSGSGPESSGSTPAPSPSDS